jgi:small subunit ribosomal protein S14
MARKCMINREKRRKEAAEKYAEQRAELKKEGNYIALAKLPRDSSPSRQRNRCNLTGRARGYLRKFGLSRIMFRDLARAGELPGVTKSSW